MAAPEVRYSLQRIRSARQDGALLGRALAIYEANTPRLEATASNEMLWWVDRYNREYSDELFIFALMINGEVVGFSECLHFYEEEFVILDYMTIAESKKSVASFFQFFELIKTYFDTIELRYRFIVAELVREHDGALTASSEFWKAMMALERFRLADADFVQLQLGRTRFETKLPARLLFSSDADITSLTRQTYLMVVRTVIMRHYTRWYRPFFSDAEADSYALAAGAAVDSIERALGTRQRIELSGEAQFVLPAGTVPVTTEEGRLTAYAWGGGTMLGAALVTDWLVSGMNLVRLSIVALGGLLVHALCLPIVLPKARQLLRRIIGGLSRLLHQK